MKPALAAALLAAALARAEDPPALKLEVGERRAVCPGVCRVAICDDPRVATLGADGVLVGVAPGRTVCSITPAAGPRRVWEVTVVVPPPSPPPGPGGSPRG